MTAKNRKAYMRNYIKTYKPKGKRVNVTLTLEEYRQLKKNATAYKTTPTKRLKELALHSLDNQNNHPPNPQQEKSLAELVHILRGIGNNINQIARHSNTFKTVVNENKVLEHLFNLEKKIKSFISNNGK